MPKTRILTDRYHCYVHVCQNLGLMTGFSERSTRVKGSISDKISSGQATIWTKLALESEIKRVILNLCNVYYLSISLSNIIC